MKKSRVTHPSGCPMQLSENLLAHLQSRKTGQVFKIGEWLSALDADLLRQLASAAEEFTLYGGQKDINPDLVFCVKTGFEAETSLMFSELNIEQCFDAVSTFCLVVSLEKIQRHGWIEVINELSISPHSSVEYKITQEGMRNKDAFSIHLH